jgi:outer membrane protein TolC
MRALALLWLLLSTSAFAAEDKIFIQEATEDFAKESQVTKPITIDIVIEQGMRKNFEENIRHKDNEILDNNLQDVKESFLYPNINLTLNSEKTRVGTLYSGSRSGLRPDNDASGSLGIELGDYTVFNWGKDYLKYLNDKEEIKREMERNKEQSRDLKQNLIAAFVKVLYHQEIIKIKKDQLRNASFIYRLNREKVTISKVSKHDYYQSRADYLRSQQEYFEAKINFQNANEELATLIDDPPGTTYVINDELAYSPLKVTKTYALKQAYQNSPYLNDATTLNNIKAREYEIAIRENMPLPKISMNIGTYKHAFGSNGSRTLFENDYGGNNLELVASVQASWALLGDGGVLNRRKLANKRLEKETTEWSYNKTRRQIESLITQMFQKFSNDHDLIKILEARLPSLKKRMDLALSRYLDKKSRYNDFHLALVELHDAEKSLVDLKWEYFSRKVLLAQIMGIEDLPGERFDTMTRAKMEMKADKEAKAKKTR